MNIAVLGGGGAMGGMLGAALAGGGHRVTLVDVSRAAVDAINAHGLSIQEKSGDEHTVKLPATLDPNSVGTVDLVINFVKCYHTEAAVRSAAPMIGPDTVVLSLQNGWGNAPRIAAIVGEDKVLVGVSYHSASLLAPGKIKHPGSGMTFVGELGGGISPRVEKVAQAFRDSGLEITASPNVLFEIWSKLALNVCTLPTGALLGFQAHQLVEHDGTLKLMRVLLDETVAVARAQGINLDPEERWDAITGLLKRAVGAKGSMLQDVEARRRTEIDVINGAISEGGQRLGLPTPHNDAMVWMMKALEETFQPVSA